MGITLKVELVVVPVQFLQADAGDDGINVEGVPKELYRPIEIGST
jgi:hypothetical protein